MTAEQLDAGELAALVIPDDAGSMLAFVSGVAAGAALGFALGYAFVRLVKPCGCHDDEHAAEGMTHTAGGITSWDAPRVPDGGKLAGDTLDAT